MSDLLRTLTPREEAVLKMHFGIGEDYRHTLREIGEHYEVGRERIRQIEAKALRKLRHRSRFEKLLPFMLDGIPLRGSCDDELEGNS